MTMIQLLVFSLVMNNFEEELPEVTVLCDMVYAGI